MSDARTLNLGEIITTSQQRDAIHIAVAPVMAAVPLKPGEHVFLTSDGEATNRGHAKDRVGIVDPYLKKTVLPGQRFWLFLYPGSITSLRHDWSHPLFNKEESESKRWLRGFAEEVGVSYNVMMDAALAHLETGDYHVLPYDTPDIVYNQREEFWRHFEAVTGARVEDKDATFFSCSC